MEWMNSLKDTNYESPFILQEINNLSNPTSIKKIEFEIKNFPQRKLQVHMTSLVNLNKHLRKK